AQQRHESLATSRRALTRLLDRRLGEREVDALAAVWRSERRTGHAAVAHRLLAEAYRRFEATHGSRDHSRRVRIVTAGRWMTGAARLAEHGQLLEAASYVGYAARWHPLGVGLGIASVARNAAARLRRRASGQAAYW